MIRAAFAVLLLGLASVAARAEAPMTLERLTEIVRAIDPDAQVAGTRMQLTVEEVPVLIFTDPTHDRMRAIVPIRTADGLSPEELFRMMQANFDAALDARYSIANGRLWAAFIHPLSPLEKDEFLSGMGQAVNLALTYGSSYTGGALTFGGGDSNTLHRDLIDKLLKQGEKI